MVHPSRRQPGRLPSDAVIARGAVAVLGLFVLVGGALFTLSFLDGDRGGGTEVAAPTRTASALPTRDLRASPRPSPTASPSSSPTSTAVARAVRARRMAAFVRDYLTTVTRDPAAAWTRLTPGFQAQSGGYDAYARFWGAVRLAQPYAVRADPARMTVEYDVSYTERDGSRRTDHPRLLLRPAGSGFLIAGEA